MQAPPPWWPDAVCAAVLQPLALGLPEAASCASLASLPAAHLLGRRDRVRIWQGPLRRWRCVNGRILVNERTRLPHTRGKMTRSVWLSAARNESEIKAGAGEERTVLAGRSVDPCRMTTTQVSCAPNLSTPRAAQLPHHSSRSRACRCLPAHESTRAPPTPGRLPPSNSGRLWTPPNHNRLRRLWFQTGRYGTTTIS